MVSTTNTTTVGRQVVLTLFMVIAVLSLTSQNNNSSVEALAGVFRRALSRGVPRVAAGTRTHKAAAAFVSVKASSSSSSSSSSKDDDTTKSVLPTASQTTTSSSTQSAFFDADMYRQEMTDLVYQRQMNRLNLS
mmetsp:Transcript_58621/g.143351  ORF Transcript_58621/g.143351 Transcript_58621/m.143351 type:complete len:134 (+) Transcript_58621:222-623(+)|eukprot:CAMPEP_0113460322 /NCGR_PEP_ID=MMETSP0014_2-20120614/10924_1 /TAXON_ID=2857 /ORGANISM="Nitzschia sp." /LENGTH=133 /DNA_ID=CAMNT_0000351965 /DNA_START=91 /DNA_END=492 /DNA_ORIENTATION=+ /assembly_acc=CAM_ASM_000159